MNNKKKIEKPNSNENQVMKEMYSSTLMKLVKPDERREITY